MSVLCLALTFPCAVFVALARTSSLRPLAHLALGFVYAVRAVPLLMLMFWIYFFLPVALGFPLSGFWSIVLAIVAFQTAYLSEVIRAAIEALPLGQTEAARALGLSYFAITWKVVLPQALLNALPGILNQFTSIIKDTSLGYVLSVSELTYAAGNVNNLILTKPFDVYALLALVYFFMCFSVTRAARGLELRVNSLKTRAETAW